jgi:S-adenosylmethionine hydrolase
VSPNNGTLSHLKQFVGIELAYEIDVEKNRRQGAFNQSYTFDGRDLYAYIGARLASNKLQLNEVGSLIEDNQIIELELPTSSFDGQCVKGSIEIFDERYGSLWTSILVDDFFKLSPKYGQIFDVIIWHNELRIFADTIVYGKAFNDVPINSLVIYVNSLNRMAIAINQGSVSKEYSISSGLEWKIEIKPSIISSV